MKIVNRSFIPRSLIILMLVVVGLLLFLPPEQSLGHIIKAVYVHAALVQTGLILFTTAGIFGLLSLLLSHKKWLRWTCAVQKSGVIVWSLYVFSSMIVTRLAWGVFIAWEEPRVRSSIEIWFAALLFLLLVWWIKNIKFTAITNIIMAVCAWLLTKSAGMIRHPLDPIGSSGSFVFKIFFMLIFAAVIVMAVQLTRLLYGAHEKVVL